MSSSVGQGSASAKATAYTIERNSLDNTSMYNVVTTAGIMKDYLGMLPMGTVAELQSVIDDVEWLHLKIEERVTMDVRDYSIMDFTRRYVWQGNEYYLERNSITQNPEKTVQRVELVRWYVQ